MGGGSPGGPPLVFHVLLLVLGAFYAIDYYNWAVDNDELDQGFSWIAWLLPLVLLPVLIIIMLALTRRSFTVQAPVGIYRKFGLSVLGGAGRPVGVVRRRRVPSSPTSSPPAPASVS